MTNQEAWACVSKQLEELRRLRDTISGGLCDWWSTKEILAQSVVGACVSKAIKESETMLVDNWCVYGIPNSVAASKYPMSVETSKCNADITDGVRSRAQCEKGTGHDQFLTGIIVQFDLTFSIKAWVEAERYHFLDFVSSQSTMHRITRMDVKKQCNEYVDERIINTLNELVESYNRDKTPENYLKVLYNVPVGFRLTARMTTNYRQLKTIYAQRHDHRLPEWREFCKWVEGLPHAEEFITGSNAEV